jgi:hypothetical protein
MWYRTFYYDKFIFHIELDKITIRRYIMAEDSENKDKIIIDEKEAKKQFFEELKNKNLKEKKKLEETKKAKIEEEKQSEDNKEEVKKQEVNKEETKKEENKKQQVKNKR